MKYLKKLAKWVAILFALLIVILYLTDTDYLIKAVRTIYLNGHTTAYLEDYKHFDNKPLEVGTPEPWPNHKDYNSAKATEKLQQTNTDLGTIAYVIIKNDSIWFEKYYDGFNENSKSNSFSMAKSYVSAMLGKAIMEGHIKSLDQPVCDFIPEFCDGKASKLTVGDLSSMSSGTNWDERYYSPFSITTRAYFDDDLTKVMTGLKVVNEPGQAFKYASGDTQMLAIVIERATGKNLYKYLSESFWKPMGSENQALWQLDSEEHDLVKAYCCIASNAKDFARMGKLYKDHGKWNGKQLLDSAFIAKSVTPRFKESPQYGYGWWLRDMGDKSFFMMRGHLGQYVIVEPNDNVIIVRLGHSKGPGDAVATFTPDITTYIEEAYKMLGDAL
ncbi:serine hydrolase domain-containing protein [Mangrovimonas spongiae]|uniref:Class C beta-lactamase-related serine hydrolase n=1 Tax=Mangrovimonas spongiae TaxID=2494697 RepID=A0A3R9MAX7_9FLAO|nr:serine hydrolase [Mangrovimonas spongiae]RSK41453.1 class C beta-lactamase-related serine hydrolase [Mangrovimonas spongiae]